MIVGQGTVVSRTGVVMIIGQGTVVSRTGVL